MTALIRYEALKSALAEALTIDEVKDIRDKAEAMRAYARMANDEQLELDAAEYRVRAERRLGELIEDERRAEKLSKGAREVGTNRGTTRVVEKPASLAQRGIDKNLAHRARKMAAMPEDIFEAGIQRVRNDVKAGKRAVSLDFAPEIGKRNAETRRKIARELSDTSAQMPIGRKYPVIYADPAWSRKAGIGNRAYENHFPTMTWDQICALPISEMLLPDAWLYLWIPRAHLFAATTMELGPDDCDSDNPVMARVPLAWRVAQSWGFDEYSTCCVWTKTDEDHSDAHGTGLIFWDQDELLLLFKRGNGLPKPDSAIKFGSNHRERPREHSRKPTFYRDMIRAMAGQGVPVLELFARQDPANPWPVDWHTWGNQDHDPDTGEILESPLTDDPTLIRSPSIDSESEIISREGSVP